MGLDPMGVGPEQIFMVMLQMFGSAYAFVLLKMGTRYLLEACGL